ncbi:MAG: hypothetical protein GY749_48165 [Desulfobacteraceae bacterium]|nr:hypothetical protein [Desulfobacteraceae bacterium]
MPKTKKCKSCKTVLSVRNFNRDRRTRDKLSNICSSCTDQIRQAVPDELLEKSAKRCVKCLKLRHYSAFSPDRRCTDGYKTVCENCLIVAEIRTVASRIQASLQDHQSVLKSTDSGSDMYDYLSLLMQTSNLLSLMTEQQTSIFWELKDIFLKHMNAVMQEAATLGEFTVFTEKNNRIVTVERRKICTYDGQTTA